MDESKLTNLIDQKMREFITVIQSSDPHEKSRLISELQKNHAVMLNRMDNQDVLLHEIVTHVEKTNGRVSKLENWRSYVNGGSYILGVLIFMIVGLASYIFNKEMNLMIDRADRIQLTLTNHIQTK